MDKSIDISELQIKYSSLLGKFTGNVKTSFDQDSKKLIGDTKQFAIIEEFIISLPDIGKPVLKLKAFNKLVPGKSFTVEYNSRIIGNVVSRIKGFGPFLFGKLILFENENIEEIACISVPKISNQILSVLPNIRISCPLNIDNYQFGNLSLRHNLQDVHEATISVSSELRKHINPWLLLSGMALLVKRFAESGG